MGRRERDSFRQELTELGKHRDESDAYLAQNRRTADAEDKCGPIDRLIVRHQVD